MGSEIALRLLRDNAAQAGNGSTVPFLKYLVQQRRHSISLRFEQLLSEGREQAGRFIGEHCARLINPILLCTALAVSEVQQHDYEETIEHYLSGDMIDWLETDLLRVTERIGKDEISSVLDAEQRFVHDAIILALDRYLGTPVQEAVRILAELRQKTSTDQHAEAIQLVRAATWIEFNPPLQYMHLSIETLRSAPRASGGLAETARQALIRYGQKHNSAFHNTVEYFEDHLADCKKRINQALRAPVVPDARQQTLETERDAYSNAVGLLERAKSFYFWNPSEIYADLVSHRVSGEVTQMQQTRQPDG